VARECDCDDDDDDDDRGTTNSGIWL
jgi:hypothetical protein